MIVSGIRVEQLEQSSHRRAVSIVKSVRTTTDTRSGTARLSTRIGRAAGLNGDSSADGARDADDLRFLNLTWHTVRLRHHAGLTDLAAGRVRNLTGPNLLSHRASRVRDLLGDGLTGPRAGRVRNLLGDGFAGPRAGCVRDFLADGFAGP